MLDHVFVWGKGEPSDHKLDLATHADNARAIALYRSRGFVR